MTLFPRPNTRTVRVDEMKLMFAMVKWQKVSPVEFMMTQWIEVFKLTRDIECTSLVTRIANKLGLMENCLIEQIAGSQPYITFDYFRQGQMLKRTNCYDVFWSWARDPVT